MRLVAACALLSTTLLVGACASPTTPSNTPAPTTSATPAASAPAAIPMTPSPEASSAVDAALQDASAHLGVTPDQLQVTQVDARQWGDASLGCPEAGQLYSQIVTPGFLIVITSGARQLEYHSDSRAHVKLCRES
jgi:hypothetical protein